MHKLIHNLQIQLTTRTRYRQLAHAWSLPPDLPPTKAIYAAVPIHPNPQHLPPVIGLVVYSMPLPDLRARTQATAGWFKRSWEIRKQLRLVNKHIRFLSRGWIDPRYRRLGIATWLLEQTIALQDVPIIESLTPIDFKKAHLEKLGFLMYPNPDPRHIIRFRKALLHAQIYPSLYSSPRSVDKRIHLLTKSPRATLDQQIRLFMQHYKSKRRLPAGLEQTSFFLSKLQYPRAYYIRFKPDHPVTQAISRRKRGVPHHTEVAGA